jgi:hypothetical protein
MSPHALFKVKYAKFAPNFVGKSISVPEKHFESVTFAAARKATVIAFFSTDLGYSMVKPYLEAVEEAYPSNPSVGVVRIQHEEHWVKWLLVNYYLKSRYLRPLYTPEQQVFPTIPC